jgi:hypothetical protein
MFCAILSTICLMTQGHNTDQYEFLNLAMWCAKKEKSAMIMLHGNGTSVQVGICQGL